MTSWVGLAVGLSGAAAATALAPTGAKIEPSGFATIPAAPHLPYPAAPPPAQFPPGDENAWYARDAGVPLAEAVKRRREQEALRPEFERLLNVLRQREAGNFTAPRIVHTPDWAYEIYFKRDPARTLAKYTSHPRFVARLARYSRSELEAIRDAWGKRFAPLRLSDGVGTDDTYGTVDFVMTVTKDEVDAIAARQGWPALPGAVRLSFAKTMTAPPVSDRARPYLRAFAQSERSAGVQLTAGYTGRIVLRDGCLRVGAGKDAPLAYFHRETGVGRDEQGYLVLVDRRTGKPSGRIGEWFSWAGPNGLASEDRALAELRARCGTGPVSHVGNPESLASFRARPTIIDSVALERRIGRQAAWDWLKRCWARQERARPDRPPEEICRD